MEMKEGNEGKGERQEERQEEKGFRLKIESEKEENRKNGRAI